MSKPNIDSQIYRYAKGWFKRTDTIADLRVLYGNRNLIAPEHITADDIVLMLVELAAKHTLGTPEQAVHFFQSVLPNRFFPGPPESIHEAIIDACLHAIRYVEGKDIEGELAEADYTLLPSSKREGE